MRRRQSIVDFPRSGNFRNELESTLTRFDRVSEWVYCPPLPYIPSTINVDSYTYRLRPYT